MTPIKLDRETKILLLQVLKAGEANSEQSKAIHNYFRGCINPFEEMRKNNGIPIDNDGKLNIPFNHWAKDTETENNNSL